MFLQRVQLATCLMERNRDLPQCKFGSKCYRKNPDHWLHFWHPNQSLTGNEAEDDKPVVTSSAYTLPGTI